LKSLRTIEDDEHEIILVDNHDKPTIVVDDERLRVVHEPRRGLNFARNRGVVEARGKVVAYVDDDCEVEPSWLRAIRTAFSDPNVACVTGRVVAATLERPSQWIFEGLVSFDRGDHRARFVRAPGSLVTSAEPGRLGTGCNMAFRKIVFDRVGFFDEALDMGTLVEGGGDLDMFARVMSSGLVVAYEPSALVRHHHRDTLPALARQMFGYGVAISAVIIKLASNTPRPAARFLAYERAWLRWIFARLTHFPRRRRAAGAPFALLAVLGSAYGPVAYALSRRSARKALRSGDDQTIRVC
jgi:glycosyltransferase involved in cell wall biosynthesis